MTDAGARVEARGWGWRHAGRRDPAVRALDLAIEPGRRVLLLGASGAGKSTLLHGLAGILGGAEEGEHSGALLVGGVPAADARGAAGLVLQDPDAQAVLARVGDDVAFGLENLGVAPAEIHRRVPEALAAVGLTVPLEHSTTALSGGQKQRLALAGVLAMRPRLLLLDEPTANLDPLGAAEVVASVLTNLAGRTLVVVEHRVDLWWEHMDRVVVLGADRVIADGTPEQVLASSRGELEAAGVWLPGAVVALPRHPAPAAGPVLLEVRDVAVSRAGTRVRRRRRRRSADDLAARLASAAARDLSLDVRAGEVLAITGPNGAGKTTLALTLAGLLEPVTGSVRATADLADGAEADPALWRPRELLTRVGFVFQSPDHQFLATTVRAELELGQRALGGEPDAAHIDELLGRLRLDRLARAHPFSLSGGEKRRLSVATVLATRPRVLVLDEPTFGQDARTWRELVALIAELRDAGRAIVIVTHDRGLVEALDAREFVVGGAVVAGETA